jgi:uncharacterized protein
VVVVGEPAWRATGALHRAALRSAPADVVVLLGRPGATPGDSSPLLAGRDAAGGEPLAYLCENAACRPPLGSPEEVGTAVAGLRYILDA